ncbi:MAG: ATP-binding protein [Gammaproteobacteria bacterium]|nr:ATP-binding protein [Gammaproteobacteria bacterium]
MNSIKTRLTLVSMIVLVIFMILTAIALEKAVVKRALAAEEDRMQLLIYSLLAAVDRNRSGLSITISTERLFETSLMTPGSGLNAILYNHRREIIWKSRSIEESFPVIGQLQPGDWQFRILEENNKPYFRLAFALQWPDVRDRLQRYDIVVWQDASRYFKRKDQFRQTLWAWLILTTGLLLVIMYLVMLWSLRPLKMVGLEVRAIEDHHQGGFEGNYPKEIAPLTENLNILLNREKLQRQRYRNAMDDLAHSLKTPLAVLKGFSGERNIDNDESKVLREQVDRMDQIISYQLQKATSVSAGEIVKPIEVVSLINKIISALQKVYRDKDVVVDLQLPESIQLRMDEGDFLEVIGNLIDNAFKYGQSRVRVSSRVTANAETLLQIDDNGPGLEESEIKTILNRGTRLDEVNEGQGIGLAVVADIVKTYNIELSFGRSDLGGLKAVMKFQSI